MFAVNNQSTWLQVTACEVRVLLSTVMRAVFCVALSSVGSTPSTLPPPMKRLPPR